MAASPLSEINWDDLEGQSLITAVNLLQLAYSERMNMAELVSPLGFAGNNQNILSQFPFIDNNPDVGRSSWPAMWGSQTPETGISIALGSYLSETKLNNVLGTTPTKGFNQRDIALDEDTLLTDLGIPLTGNRSTEYPRMDIITAESVKFWYDYITSLKYILVDHTSSGGGGSNNNKRFLSSYSEGIFKGNSIPLGYGPAKEFPLSQLPIDWAAIWGGPKAKALIAGSNPNLMIIVDIVVPFGTVEVRAMNTYSRFDTSDYDNTGLVGSPIDIRTYGSFFTFSASASGAQWIANNGYVGDLVVQLPSASRTVLAGNMVERNIALNAPSLPPIPPDVGANDVVVRSQHGTYECWDGEGGFEFYTPT